MRKLTFFFLVNCLTCSPANGQTRIIDSLRQHLTQRSHDTLQLVLFDRLGETYGYVNYDSSSAFSRKAALLAQELNYPLHEAKNLLQAAVPQIVTGNSASGLGMLNRAQTLLGEIERSVSLLPSRYLTMLEIPAVLHSADKYRLFLTGQVYGVLALMYLFDAEKEKAKAYILKAKVIAETLPSPYLQITNCVLMGNLFVNEPDSALPYLNKGYQLSLQTGNKHVLGDICNYIAKAYHLKKESEKELLFRRASLHYNLEQENLIFAGWSFLSLADYFKETHDTDSTIFYCHKAIEIALNSNTPPMEFWSCAVLKDVYKALNKTDSAFKYMERMIAAKDRSSMDQQAKQLQTAEFNQLLRQKDFEAARLLYQNKVRIYVLIGGLSASVLIAALMWRNIRHKQKAYALVQQQKQETESAYMQLKTTQSQLVQREKMASLGELTAGIAHEIQNPLNFVNNFSEATKELAEELTHELALHNIGEAKTLATEISNNADKIVHHGRRADSIVKGMLQHARASTGKKEAVNINRLVEEYLRLSYQGMRAKDNAFNTTMETHFDDRVGELKVIPQDIGRVLMNLLNNAFYAVSEKMNQSNSTFNPTVSVSTERKDGSVIIAVKDNGIGMSQKVAEKVFQPFFTTKPTGEGTGLGLSLCYDIITKGHGGELRVMSKEGEGAIFTIELPQVQSKAL